MVVQLEIGGAPRTRRDEVRSSPAHRPHNRSSGDCALEWRVRLDRPSARTIARI
jgi:hypothetical protein